MGKVEQEARFAQELLAYGRRDRHHGDEWRYLRQHRGGYLQLEQELQRRGAAPAARAG